MPENRLGINVGVTGTAEAASQINVLREQIKSLNSEIQKIQGGSFGNVSAGIIGTLRKEIAGLESQIRQLSSAFIQPFAGLDTFSIRAIAAMRGQADAIKGVARELSALDAIGRGGISRSGRYS